MSKDNWNGGTPRRHNPSLFGPIVLIAIGVYFLLSNVGALPETSWNWNAVWQLWPLWLIFIGLNIIVRQAPRPLGSMLSGIVGLAAIGVFGYVLLYAENNVILERLDIPAVSADLKSETISFSGDDLSRARINLGFGIAGANVQALDDSRDLLAGEVTYIDELVFDTEVEGGEATVTLRPSSGFGFSWPSDWGHVDATWELGLNPRIETDLRVDAGVGKVDLDLSELDLSYFELDGGVGTVEMVLPGGNYDVRYDAGTGASEIWVGDSGRQSIEIDGGTGRIQVNIPEGMEARVEVNDGAGSFSIGERFTQVSGQERDDGVWETAGYEDAPDRVDIYIDIGTGSVRVRDS